MSGHISKGVCTWLECCGHLSVFEIGGIRYYVDAEIFDHWDKRAQNMQMRLDTVLHHGQTCSYEYDFGSTTELRIKVIAEREVPASGNLIRMLARNSSPILCDICGKPATSTCTPCSNDDEAYLCDDCAKHHQCEPEKLSPIVNSPRAGVCGYTGDTLAYTF